MNKPATATATHTAGPWIVVSGCVIQDGPDVWPKGDINGIVIAHMNRLESRTSPVERDANSHLMAAAPDMLVALQMLVPWMEDTRLTGTLAAAVHAAIEKALPS